MAVSVHDELNYAGPGTVTLGSGAAPNWTTAPGCSALVVGGGANYMTRAVMSAANGAAYWSADTFLPDQYAEASLNPLFWSTNTTVPRAGAVCVRQSTSENSCYALFPIYEMLPGGRIDEDGVSYGRLVLSVYRINAGVYTLLQQIEPPGWLWSDDYWFGQLQVWGQNPVRLRVLCKAPAEYVLGTTNAPATASGVGQLPAACDYLISGTTYNSEQWRMDSGASIADAPTYFTAPANSGAVAFDAVGADMNAGRAWTVWEGTDSSTDRLLSGQPALRYGPNAWFNIAKFSAAEIDDRLTARVLANAGDTATVGGYRVAASTVTASCPTATVGTVTYPDATSWQVEITGLDPGANTVTAGDGTDSIEVAVPGPESTSVTPTAASMQMYAGTPLVASSSVLIDAVAASMQLYAGTPLVSASMLLGVEPASMLLAAGIPRVTTGAVSAFKSTDGTALPLKVWNGSGWVDVPLRLWDGSTFLN